MISLNFRKIFISPVDISNKITYIFLSSAISIFLLRKDIINISTYMEVSFSLVLVSWL